MRRTTVDLTPAQASLLAYQGDPFDFRIVLTVDGRPADVSRWTWLAWIQVDPATVVPFLWDPEPDGVRLYLRGEDTFRLPDSWSRFDVTGRDPDAGEGRTVLRGDIIAYQRVTPPLRAGAEVGPIVVAGR